jgi:hypothetical protein
MSSFFDYVGADMTAEGGQGQKPQSVIERLERQGYMLTMTPQDNLDLQALIAVAKAARKHVDSDQEEDFQRLLDALAELEGR